jgi:hypothetical protein
MGEIVETCPPDDRTPERRVFQGFSRRRQMDREGDYQEPQRVVREGAFAWIGEHGHPHVA